MTTYGTGGSPVKVSRHPTLTANTTDTVIMASGTDVEILNRGTDAIYFTTDGTTPTVAGNDVLVVPAGGSVRVPTWSGTGTGASVKLIAATAVPYSVTAVS